MLHKQSKSIRIPKRLQKKLGREMVRVSLNPVLLARTAGLVRWDRRSKQGRSPVDVVLLAHERYPQLSLSAAVETVLVDLLLDACSTASFLRKLRASPM